MRAQCFKSRQSTRSLQTKQRQYLSKEQEDNWANKVYGIEGKGENRSRQREWSAARRSRKLRTEK